MKVVAFVPIRLNSKRVVGKNLKPLGGKPLMWYILETLARVKNIDEVYVYCSSEEIIPYLPEGIKYLKRSEWLDRDETLGEEIYDAFTKEVDADVYMLAHTTSIHQGRDHLQCNRKGHKRRTRLGVQRTEDTDIHLVQRQAAEL